MATENPFVITSLVHRLDLTGTQAACICHSRTGHAGEDHTCENICVAQTTWNMSDCFLGQTKYSVTESDLIHCTAHKNEKLEPPKVSSSQTMLPSSGRT